MKRKFFSKLSIAICVLVVSTSSQNALASNDNPIICADINTDVSTIKDIFYEKSINITLQDGESFVFGNPETSWKPFLLEKGDRISITFMFANKYNDFELGLLGEHGKTIYSYHYDKDNKGTQTIGLGSFTGLEQTGEYMVYFKNHNIKPITLTRFGLGVN